MNEDRKEDTDKKKKQGWIIKHKMNKDWNKWNWLKVKKKMQEG
jgi:hypothetical protein